MRIFLLFFVCFILGGPAECGKIVADLEKTNITVKWFTSFENQAVEFSVSYGFPTPAVIFIGFSDNGDVNNTDGILFYPKYEKVEDVWIDRNYHLQSDWSQDIAVLRVTRSHFVFRRKLVTCDPKDYAFQAGTTEFLVAANWRSEHVGNMQSNDWKWDKKFGLVVDKQEQKTIEEESVVEEVDSKVVLVNSNSKEPLPGVETTYKCIIRRMPFNTQKRKFHIIRMEPFVAKGNEHLVHHMEVFLCRDEVEEWNGDCNDPKKPKKSSTCSHVIAAWAMGEGPIVYPSEAGLPFGGNGQDEYVMVEIHYNNVEKLTGVMDNSGFQFTVTENLRKYDAAIMELGLIYSDANSIPPGQKAFAISGYCPSQCTRFLPEGGINIFGSQLHAHLTGRKLWTSHYRNGVKIGEINRDDHYSPHWQHLQEIKPYINVQPGDVLTTTCVYDTRKREKMTLGGYGIADEMCVNYIYYYPASNVEVCKSAISNTTLRQYFKQRYQEKNPSTPISQLYANVDWTPSKAEELHNLYSVGNLKMDCLQSHGDRFPFVSDDKRQSWNNMAKPRFHSNPIVETRDPYECPAMNDLVNFD